MVEEPWEEYQIRFKKALGDELDRLSKPENQKKELGGESIMNKCILNSMLRNTKR